MKVIGFVGPSGTGKSYRAMWVANQNQIDLVIDDGLLLSDHKVLAGISAKKEPTKLASVRRALFTEEKHAKEVRKAIKDSGKDCILILGTSEGMIERIATVLELPAVERYIRIEDVATKEEIENARQVRTEQGKHVIPAPTFAIKKDFSGYFMDSVKSLLGYKTTPYEDEKTVVRPTFSYLGDYVISDRVLTNIAYYEAEQVQGVAQVQKVTVQDTFPEANLRVDIVTKGGYVIHPVAKEIQERVRASIEANTGINVGAVNIWVKSIEFDAEES